MNLQLFSEEKREQPTQRRRQEARRRGQVVHSGEVALVAILLSAAIALRASGRYAAAVIESLARQLWSQAGSMGTGGFRRALGMCLDAGALAVLPVVGTLALASLAVEVAQVGLTFSAEPVSPRLDRIDPVRGLGRIFSRQGLAALLKALVKMAIVAVALYQAGRLAAGELPGLAGASLSEASGRAAGILWSMTLRCCTGLAVVAAADYYLQWRENERSLMMTRKEMLEEIKETEGRPEVRQRLRARQRQLSRGRMILAIRKADVVVTNPEHFAVALQYEARKAPAPVLVAKGAGHFALRIKGEASKHRVPVVANPPLARALFRSVDVGDLIPPVLYKAVAEILAFVYRLKPRSASPEPGGIMP